MCPKLECLALIDVSGFCAIEWTVIIEMLGQRLRHFAVGDCPNIESKSLFPIIPYLEEVVLIYHLSPLTELLSNLGPNIRKISMKCCEDSKIETIIALTSGNGKRLTHLTVDDPSIEEEVKTLELICSQLKNLEYLCIGFGCLSSFIDPIVELNKLRHLEINASLQRWNNMQTLTLNTVEYLLLNTYFSPKKLIGIEKIFPNLQKFILYFHCDCDQRLKVYTYYSLCKSCNDFCLKNLSKNQFLKSVSINGEEFV